LTRARKRAKTIFWGTGWSFSGRIVGSSGIFFVFLVLFSTETHQELQTNGFDCYKFKNNSTPKRWKRGRKWSNRRSIY
jgi:hypothetical protein